MKIAIMGFGTIGSGVYEVLENNKEKIAANVGQVIEVKHILDLRDFPDSPAADKITHDFGVIAQDEEVAIVVEAMGGVEPAYTFVKTCLEAGKNVVTSNKALVAAHGTELLQIARDKNINFQFEASVGGGIPIIRPLYTCLMGEKVEEITGILNGTTNFILTKMDKEGASFDAVLKEAQALGYAEADPTADVGGHDTCRKISILTAMATGKEVNYEDIYTEGITKITDTDFKYAEKLGTSVKLFGSSRIEGDKVVAFVAPMMIAKEHPLYAVSDVYNGVLVKTNMLGTSMYYGRGAGKLPTASAVVADIMEEAKNLNNNIPLGWGAQKLAIAPVEESAHAYFVRVAGAADALAEVACRYLGQCKVVTLDGLDEFAVVTEVMSEKAFNEAKEALEEKLAAAGSKVLQRIRVQA